MGSVNKHVLVAAFVVGGSGLVNAYISHKPVTRILVGTYVFLLLLSIMDAIGGALSTIASGLAMLAMMVALLTVFPWQQIASAIGKKA